VRNDGLLTAVKTTGAKRLEIRRFSATRAVVLATGTLLQLVKNPLG